MRLSVICGVISIVATVIGSLADVIGKKDEMRRVIEDEYGIEPIKKNEESD